MTASQFGPAPAETGQANSTAERCQPMPLQDAFGNHGHAMHPQKFVRLIGCHEPHLPQPLPKEQAHWMRSLKSRA